MHYRKIWEKSYGKIPNGYEIHHIDGDRKNNSLENLKLVSIEEHLAIHRERGDLGAVQSILIRMEKYNLEEISKIASINQKRLSKEGKHNFQKIDRVGISKKTMFERLSSGKPAFLGITDTKENGRRAGLIAKEKNAGYLNTNSDKHGSKYVKNTFWWTHVSGARKRSEICPGQNWKKGMKYYE